MDRSAFEALSFVVADDNGHMRQILRAILHALGARNIRDAEDGAKALELIESYMPDILITDLKMPILDGIELTRLIRNPKGRMPFLPIIMLTGYTERWRINDARDAGVTEFLAKPISSKALLDRIQMTVDNPRPFVQSKDYFGPCRRRQNSPFKGEGRRKSDNRELIKLASDQHYLAD
ncbi:MAG: two-component system response regulator [Hyphomicrobiales bacterium]|nr:MAG: two-component system response regulator [Hyphomicrobiales bacterium]